MCLDQDGDDPLLRRLYCPTWPRVALTDGLPGELECLVDIDTLEDMFVERWHPGRKQWSRVALMLFHTVVVAGEPLLCRTVGVKNCPGFEVGQAAIELKKYDEQWQVGARVTVVLEPG